MQSWKSADCLHQTSVIVKPSINIFTVYVGLTASGYDLGQYSSDDSVYGEMARDERLYNIYTGMFAGMRK